MVKMVNAEHSTPKTGIVSGGPLFVVYDYPAADENAAKDNMHGGRTLAPQLWHVL
jgi:hypothetical protein